MDSDSDKPPHWCDPSVSVCTCGKRWEIRIVAKRVGKTSYTSKQVRDLYYYKHGAPDTFSFEDNT